jgi:pantoate--beta-alanine ligase
MYPEPQRVFVEVEGISEYLYGRNRTGHFRCVATVVLKLFRILQLRFAFFGEKDYQQLAIVRRFVRDLNVPVDVVGVPTVRECDGLAMSSRNSRLTSTERSLAPCLYKALLAARGLIASGERKPWLQRTFSVFSKPRKSSLNTLSWSIHGPFDQWSLSMLPCKPHLQHGSGDLD